MPHAGTTTAGAPGVAMQRGLQAELVGQALSETQLACFGLRDIVEGNL
jgi:hypothetical protein